MKNSQSLSSFLVVMRWDLLATRYRWNPEVLRGAFLWVYKKKLNSPLKKELYIYIMKSCSLL